MAESNKKTTTKAAAGSVAKNDPQSVKIDNINDQNLKEDAGKIMKLHTESEKSEKTALEAGKDSVLKKWEAGKVLREVKEKLAYGKFELWLGKNLPNIQQATRCRYMKLAKIFPDKDSILEEFKEYGSLNAIYKKHEITGKSGNNPSSQNRSGSEPKTEIEKVHSVLTHLEKDGRELKKISNEVWGDGDVQRFKESIKPFLEIAVQLGIVPQAIINTTQEEEGNDAE